MFSKEKHLSCSQNILEFNLQEPKVPNQIIIEQFYIESALHYFIFWKRGHLIYYKHESEKPSNVFLDNFPDGYGTSSAKNWECCLDFVHWS